MEAAEETLRYLDDTGLHRKLLLQDRHKDKKKPDSKSRDTTSDESNYVDLDVRPEGAKSVKVTFTGDGGHLSVIKCDPSNREEAVELRGLVPGELPLETLDKLFNSGQCSDNDQQLGAELQPSDCSEHVCSGSDELRYTDMYLNSRTESDDGASAVLSDTVEDESHYITTHEIQLTELDHDVDYDLGRGTCWELEDDNLVYSFVDYASFESDETQEGTLVMEGRSLQTKVHSHLDRTVVTTEQEDEEESDLCDSDKSSDESVYKNQNENGNKGKIHLSIKTSSRAVPEAAGIPDNSGARAVPLCDRAQYFIPAPGRQHLATKLRRKDINEYSSGASSSISELDDADKEVRNLTAKSFRSLACPYFDAINLSTSSESSMSEYGLNKWSTYVDWNNGKGVIAQQTSRATLAMNKTVDNKNKASTDSEDSQNKQNNNRVAHQQTCSKEVKDPAPPTQTEVTLNFHCDVEEPDGGGRQKPIKNSRCGTGDPQKSSLASSLLKNVISKKMQFEQERKMERGRVGARRSAVSPEKSLSRGLQRQSSESGSGLSINTTDDQCPEGSRPSSCGPAEGQKNNNNKVPNESEQSQHQNQHQNQDSKVQLSQSQRSAFNSIRAGEPEPAKEDEDPAVSKAHAKEDTSSMLTKLLFVPRWQLLAKEKNFNQDDVEKGLGPEIKIRLRSVKENKGCTLNIANLLTPKISYSAVNTFRAAGDGKCHLLSAADKFPNFSVRNIRETKCKFQTPIYRVRDVRKLVKSSYGLVSMDNESKCSKAAEKLGETSKTGSSKHFPLPAPIVIQCHSVNTFATSQASKAAPCEGEHARPSVASKPRAEHPDCQPCSDSKLLAKQKQEKFTGDTAEKRNEAAIEKLKAAVKTMEQLYVFDRNEWKRKTQSQLPRADGHTLRQSEKPPETTNTNRVSQASSKTTQQQEAADVIHVPYTKDTFKTQSQQGRTFSRSSLLHFGNNNKAHVSIASVGNSIPQSSRAAAAAAAAPLSVKIEPPKHVQVEQGKVKIIPTNPAVTQACGDSEDYLAIPGQGYTSEIKVHNQEPASREGDSSISQSQTGETPEQKRSPLIMECPAASIYHHPAAATTKTVPQAQQQVMSISPSDPTMTSTSPVKETAPQTQRKMLLDPSTGHYYLVDTPIQATTKRLFDPETGQYVDVPVPHSGATPVTPVPLSLSPLTLSPGAYTPTYMIYPGFISSPPLQAQTVLPQSPSQSEDTSLDKVKHATSPKQDTCTSGPESVYYSATAEAPQGPLKLPASVGHLSATAGGAGSARKPLISITSQQGPRIVAPPSFDGTTMSFVVEHR